MALMLGIDTGGTFTDAVLVDDDTGLVVASAKSPTTHHDLTKGISGSVRRVLEQHPQAAAHNIALVSVSTTLATNALVEGHGEPAGLLVFGFSEKELERTGVGAVVGPSLMVALGGGHDAHGNEREPLDIAAIEHAAMRLRDSVSAFAVAAQFSVRNPAHEQQAAQIIRSATDLPVSSSHDLSAKLDGPRRALTAALNARLLGTIDRLNRAVESVLASQGIEAPLMVVRGDGSLVTAAFAGARPIETVLSGPAASVIGALHLAELDCGLVVDIGGTTTDVAVVANGRPAITAGGAVVGNHRTMVEAVDMATIGLGGDSEVRIDTRAADGPVLLGPERAIPICRLAAAMPSIHNALDRWLAEPVGTADHGRFYVSTAAPDTTPSDAREAAVLKRLQDGPLPVAEAATSGLELRAATRLQSRGLIRVATMTPTDASCLVGLDRFSREGSMQVDDSAAAKVASLVARQTGFAGAPIAADGPALARQVIDVLIRRSADFVTRVALGSDGVDYRGADGLLAASLGRHAGAAAVNISLTAPLTAIGAPASSYYHGVAELTGTQAIVPEHAEVANAIGAVVGRVRVRRSVSITQPTRGQFRVHLDDQPTFGSVEKARVEATISLRAAVLADADEAGAATPELTERWQQRVAHMDGKDVFIEGTLTIEASGRPRL